MAGARMEPRAHRRLAAAHLRRPDRICFEACAGAAGWPRSSALCKYVPSLRCLMAPLNRRPLITRISRDTTNSRISVLSIGLDPQTVFVTSLLCISVDAVLEI